MKRLEEIKNEIAIKHHYGYWVDLVSQNDMLTIDKYHNEAIHQYAREVAQASLEKAAENAELYYCNNIHSLKRHQDTYLETDPGWYVALDKQSIINNQNIIIL